MTKCLGSDCWLCGVGTREGEEYCPDPEGIDYLGGEAGWNSFSHTVKSSIANSSNISSISNILAERGYIHPYDGGQVEGGHEEDQQAGLYGHGHLVSCLVHDQAIEQSARTVEHRGDGSNDAKELIIKDECLAKCFIEPRDYLRDEDD